MEERLAQLELRMDQMAEHNKQTRSDMEEHKTQLNDVAGNVTRLGDAFVTMDQRITQSLIREIRECFANARSPSGGRKHARVETGDGDDEQPAREFRAATSS